MEKTIISTHNAPEAIGPYSQAVQFGNFLFTSGQIPIDPATNMMIDGDVTAQAHQVMENLKAVLAAAGMDFTHVLKATVFLKDMNNFQEMNAVYSSYFSGNCPAREAVQAAALPKNALVEISMIAAK